MKKLLLFSVLCLLFTVSVSAQVNPVDLRSTITIDTARINLKANTIKNIEDAFLSIGDSLDTQKLESAFWGMELINYKNDNIKNKISGLFDNFSNYETEFQRSLLQVVFSMFPNCFIDQITSLLPKITNEKQFAMASNYLLRNNYSKDKLIKQMTMQFPNFKENPILYLLQFELTENFNNRFAKMPPIMDLLKHNFGNYPVVFSIQRHNRDYQGIAVVRNAKGTLVTRKDGFPFFIKQLARAVTNLNGYLTNGNTPQGIFSILNIGQAKSKFIGPSPMLHLVLPYEVESTQYFHNPNPTVPEWNIDLYKNMLPESWKNYTPFYEAYYAGKAGRNDILSHGTTVDPTYYKDAPFFPNTPTYGCLCALEIWNAKDGRLLQSDQVDLINALISINFNQGYLVVVEIDDQQKDVTIQEVLELFGQSVN